MSGPQQPKDRNQIDQPQDLWLALKTGLSVLFSNAGSATTAVIGLLGVLLSFVLVFLEVEVEVEVEVAGSFGQLFCGSVLAPTQTTFGPQTSCGPALSTRAVESGGFLIGGLGLFFGPLLAAGLCRAFLLMGLTVALASLVGLSQRNSSIFSALAAVYALVMTVLVGRRGFKKEQ